MRPCTPHYVLTLQHSITNGAHFYATSTVRDTYIGIIHLFIGNASLTNIDHPNARVLLRRLMAMWIQQYEQFSSGSVFFIDWPIHILTQSRLCCQPSHTKARHEWLT
jgi:hypothetical protein